MPFPHPKIRLGGVILLLWVLHFACGEGGLGHFVPGGGAGMEGCLNIIIESPKDISLESGTFLLLQNLTNSPLLQSVLAEDAVRCVVTLMTSRFDLQKLRSASRLLSKVKDNIIVVLAGPEEEPLAVDVLAQLPFLPPLLWVPPSLNKSKKSIHLYCPKYGQPHEPEVLKIVPNEFNLPSAAGRGLLSPCPSPLRGQTLTMSVIPGGPHVYNLGGKRGRINGYSVNAFLALADYLEFSPRVRFSKLSLLNLTSRTFTDGIFKEVQDGVTDISFAPQNFFLGMFFDIGAPLSTTSYVFATRTPIPMNRMDNLWLPFDVEVWLSIAVTLLSLSLFFLLCHEVYSSISLQPLRLVRHESSKFNFFLFPLAKLTEPDPLPWFKGLSWSAGRFATLLWSVLSISAILFYISNLRANLITPRYERPLQTLADIVDNGQKVFMFRLSRHTKSFLEETGQAGTDIYRVVDLVEKTDGLYYPRDHGGLHRSAPAAMASDRAVALMPSESVPYLYLRDPLLVRERIRLIEEPLDSFYATFITRKHSPATNILHAGVRRIVEAGIIDCYMTRGLSFRGLLRSRPKEGRPGPYLLQNFYSLFAFFAMGVSCSAVALAWELMRKNWRKRKTFPRTGWR